MDFNLYFLDDTPVSVEDISIEDLESPLSGLSGGEARQSLLDYFREDVEGGDLSFINQYLSPLGLDFPENIEDDSQAQENILTEIENYIYDLDDEELANTIWGFHNEIIYITGE